jgi:phosphoserine phosphatase
MSDTPPGYALFDLDHTLLPHDTQALFCNYVLRRERWRTLLHLLFLPFALLRALGAVSTLRAKRAFNGYLWGLSRAQLQRYADAFASQSAHAWLYPELGAELDRHRREGRVLVMNTASPDFYGDAVGRALGFMHVFATRSELTDPLSFHPAISANNKRAEKITAMVAAMPELATITPEQRANSWAYSDSAADIPLLEFAGHGVMIHPKPAYAAHGAARGWSTLLPAQPYHGRWGNVIAMLRQVLGVYPERPDA